MIKTLKDAQQKGANEGQELAEVVKEIIAKVKLKGDQALFELNNKFDGSTRQILRVSRQEIEVAYNQIEQNLMQALTLAHKNLVYFAKKQKETLRDLAEIEVMPGIFAGHRVIPIESCCSYVPGGEYPLFSSALMLVVPAKIAGVKRIIACSPTLKGTNNIHPATLVALDLAGADEIYAVGGAQAIAAAAYGTEQIGAVDLIVGPGNKYVTEAKRQCFGQVGIDFGAGPSEVLVIADGGASPEIIAADLLAQAEHDVQAVSILLTTSEDIGMQTLTAVQEQLSNLKTKDIAIRAWQDNGKVLVVDSLEEACELANLYAPEHLELMVADPEVLIKKLTNYGSLFIGELSAEVFGDYLSGTNHTLPTSSATRYTGGLWVGTFVKVCTYQYMTRRGLKGVGSFTRILAEAEGLWGHSNAVAVREKIGRF